MEVMLKRSPVVQEEKRAEGACVEQGRVICKQFENEANGHDGQQSNSSSPEQKDSNVSKQDAQLESTRAEMGEVKQENERLKMVLARIVKDYQSLQTHFFDIVQQDRHKNKPAAKGADVHGEAEESDLVLLSLGRTSSGGHKKEEKTSAGSDAKVDEQTKEDLSLSLDCKFDRSGGGPSEPDQQNSSPENSLGETKEEEAGEPWPPSKILKTLRSGDDEVSEQAHVKKARVSVRARCDAPTMNDGCQWRKYGQKIAKGNPCPRAYYRCTVAPACPVRKQVQRCAEDMSILITTYEGTHNHPLPISATAMASTTSAAACMLMSGSSASRPAIGASAVTGAPSASASLHGLNFSALSDASGQRQFYLPTPSLSSSPSYPTITLDLTSPPSSSSPSTQFSRFSSNFSSASRYGPTTFNFSASESPTTPASWASSGYLSYAAQPYNNKNQLGFFNLGRQPHEQFYQSYLQKAAANAAPMASNSQPLNDTIAAATKAITSDPSFQSALAAAITSIVGGQGTHGVAEGPGQINLKWGEQLSSVSPLITSSANGNGCGSTYLTRSMSSNPNPQQSNPTFPPPSLTMSTSKSASASPLHNKEQIN